MVRILYFLCLAFLLLSCAEDRGSADAASCEYARYFDIRESAEGTFLFVISPYDGSRDSLLIEEPCRNIICMSSSNVAALSEIGADSLVSAVSGIRYLTDPELRERWESGDLYDIGYEASLDYERIMKLDPDILVAYTVSGAEPPYLSKLRSLGIPLLVIYDHLESHPLARAEYVRLFGAMTGRMHIADSVFNAVRQRYEHLASESLLKDDPVRVLLNVPYSDVWYIPGGDNYMSRLIKDAGGKVLGAERGSASSRIISLENAYLLSLEADMWLNTGHCSTRSELSSIHQLFPEFGPLAAGRPIYNNTLRTTPEGGNDFWESGAVRPDLILEDLHRIFDGKSDSLYFYLPLD